MSQTPEIIVCPHCGGKLRVPAVTSSRTIQCGHCKQPFEYHPEGIADAKILDAVKPAVAEARKAKASAEKDGDRLIGIVAVIVAAVIAWLFAGMPRMQGISDVVHWAEMTFSWQMLIMVVVSAVAAIVSALVLVFVLGMFLSKYENVLHNLMFGLMLGIPLGVAASPLLAWVGYGTQWRTALATMVTQPVSLSDVPANAEPQKGNTPAQDSAEAAKRVDSAGQMPAKTTAVSKNTNEAVSARPTTEPFARCYDLWEDVKYEVDSYDGHTKYPWSTAEAIKKQYPACILHNRTGTSWMFPRFALGPKAAAVRPGICLTFARVFYYTVLDKMQSKRTYTADAAINAAFLSEYRAETGAYCFKPNGEPYFAMDNSSRPQPFSRDKCNAMATGYAARLEPQSAIDALCFNGDGSPVFDPALFADEAGRRQALHDDCARKFELYAKAYVEDLDYNEPESYEELIFLAMSTLGEYERNTARCFKKVNNQSVPIFPLTGPYARDPRVKAYYGQ